MHWHDHEYDEGSYRPGSYDESQVDELADRRVNPSQRVSSTGIDKTADLFAHGGALDLQTTDSQWENGITAEQHATLLQCFHFKDSHWFSGEGECLDVSHAFDVKSPCITPMTPTNSRLPIGLVKLEALDDHEWLAMQFDGSQLDDTSDLVEESKQESPEPRCESEENKENIPPKDEEARCASVDTTAVLVDCIKHLIAYQGCSALLLQEYTDLTCQSAAFLTTALVPLAIACDGTNKDVHDPAVMDSETIPDDSNDNAGSSVGNKKLKMEAGVSIHMGEKVHAMRNGDWVSYLHPDEPSQEILDVEFKPLTPVKSVAPSTGKRELVDEHVNGVSNIAGMDGNLSDDDLLALELLEEALHEVHRGIKFYPTLMYGDVCEEVKHLSMKKMYRRVGETRCHVCRY
ncbi:hypothetical protein QCA50_014936 [Cerrena zonata]|uniref:Uncharacterized protein n=1 Tax=Cerrena zonata TaxID=2478898 RepID=A0AAW0FLG1_9APHY